MPSIAFVAPLLREQTLRYVRAFAALPGVRVGVISSQSGWEEHGFPAVRIADSGDATQIVAGTRALAARMGSIDRLIGHLEQIQIPLGQARDILGLPGMGEIAARNFREKDKMKDVLRNAGVAVARHRLARSGADLQAFVAQVGYPIIVKPPAGLGSRATFRIRNADDLQSVLAWPSPGNPIQAEEFVTGQEFTCETVSIHGKGIWRSGTRYYPSPLEVLENPWMQYCVLLPRENTDHAPFAATNEAALQALGMDTGLSHMEWFRTQDGRMLVSEVGARPPGVNIMPLMSLAHGVDMVARWAELMAYDRFSPPTRTQAVGTAFFRSQGRGSKVTAIHGLAQAQEEVGGLVVDRKLPQVGDPKADGYEGEGWAIVAHPDTERVKQALKRLVELVKIEAA